VTTIQDTLDRAYRDMDPSTGMFPADWRCKVCDVLLNADGNHPAELYAGTFTGLCYRCERGPAYVVPDSELPDGARQVSHPPSCPSWRRDRTTHWAYPDCADCGGMGARVRYGHNGSYTEYCRACMDRVIAPRKVAEVELLRAVADALEVEHLRVVEPAGEQTPALASVKDAIGRVVGPAMAHWADQPVVWQPRHVLSSAEARVTRAQLKAKRAETLRRHVVTALRAEADDRTIRN
jgi:hypothetical protein